VANRFANIFTARENDMPVETARAIAVLLLVSYHVIGIDPEGGLGLPDDHALRAFSDFLIDLRMPLFAFIAGFVYALRPVQPRDLPRFLVGKMRRLLLPGAVAITAFLIASHLVQTRFDMIDAPWRAYVFPYAHYWFLQAILVIFVAFGVIDVLSRGRLVWACFALALLASLSRWGVPVNVFSVNQAIYLAPYFIFGAIFVRHRAVIVAHHRLLIVMALVGVILASWVNAAEFHATGSFSNARQDLQSLTFGLSACTLALLALPRIALLDRLGPISFTIYLYHPFGTSGMRLLLDSFGIAAIEIHLVLGILAGLMLPGLLHWAAASTRFGRLTVPGQSR